MSKSKSNHYIDRDEFTAEMDTHALECRKAKERGHPMPKCPESIGIKFLLIAQNVSTKGNFFNYPFRDEMISDAVENMVRYRYNYKKERGQAFSYFTQYAIYAFIARIKLEKNELMAKAKYVQRIASDEFIPHILDDRDLPEKFKNEYVEYLITWMEDKMAIEKEKKEPAKDEGGPVTIFMEDEFGPLGI